MPTFIIQDQKNCLRAKLFMRMKQWYRYYMRKAEKQRLNQGCGYTVPEKSDVNQISCLNISRHAEENMQRNFWEDTQEHLYVTDMMHTTV